MKKRAHVAAAGLAAAALLLAGCDDGQVKPAGASATTTTTEPAVTPSGPIGGYQPVSDVAQHARMSLDVCEIHHLLDARPVDFGAVAAVYRQGRFSDEKEGVKRTLGKFAGESRAAEDTLGRYERYLGAGWLNAFVGDAIDGIGSFAGESEAVRREAVRIGVRDQVMAAWALHELDAAAVKAAKGSFTKKSGAPHNWDEVAAYYHGERPECSPFSTVQARGDEFGIGTLLNRRIFLNLRDGQKALVGKNVLAASDAREQIVRDITIGYLQAAISSAAALDAALAGAKADEARVAQAAGWAYYRVVEPLVAAANTTSARAVAAVLDLWAQPVAGSAAKVTSALTGAYEGLGISPADVGRIGSAAPDAGAATPEAPEAEEEDEPEGGEPDDGE